MLIDFTVENFRSIKEPVTLSAVAASRKVTPSASTARRRRVKPDNEIAPSYKVEGWDFELLPVLAIFGANASGKSNVVRALHYLLHYLVVSSNLRPKVWEEFIPFLLNDTDKMLPVRFELRIAMFSTIFTYTFSLDSQRILLESLEYSTVSTKRNRLLYSRKWDAMKAEYVWKTGKGFPSATPNNVCNLEDREPYISQFVYNARFDDVENDFGIIKSFAYWLYYRMPGLGLDYEESDYRTLIILCIDEPERFRKVVNIVRLFDVGIADIEIVKDDVREEAYIVCYHDQQEGRIKFPLRWESTGTQHLLSLANKIVFAFDYGTLLMVDELGSNIHPNIVRAIVRMFQNPKTNPKRAQLIFTSHDNTLMRNDLLRRDQIWFTEKKADGSTSLYPLSDFKVRNDLALDYAYLDGRFGAVPILPGDDFMPSFEEVVG